MEGEGTELQEGHQDGGLEAGNRKIRLLQQASSSKNKEFPFLTSGYLTNTRLGHDT